MEAVEVPGCPNGSLFVANYVTEKRPDKAKFLLPDAECVSVLRLLLPLLGYRVSVKGLGDRWLLEAVRAD
ncbi:MAG: hypothetical protein TU35_007270 [Thermoproteus sp. AZ2]|uniref:Uncharacterized protein n=1 Tax=Thermoproteus sp. AZ2 TaxID=1609232 RepID=A0ACC6V205_9CREN|nr:MAG: hypothetical protein TU35_04805 [Thermoproteus sp. AZ2]